MFNTFNNNGMGMMGTMYNQAKPVQPQNTQPLTQAEQNELKKKSPTFTTELTREELLRSYCTHRNHDGSALMVNADGSGTCTICGETVMFPQDGYTKEEVEEIVLKFKNLLNVIKCEYFDVPDQIVKDFFQIMPYVERVPQLYKLAMQNFNSYNNKNVGGVNPVYGADSYNFWNSFDMIHGAGNGMVMNNGAGMGMMGGIPGQAMQQQVMMNNGMGMNAMAGNPFFAQQGQQMVMNNQQQNPGMMNMNAVNTGVGMTMSGGQQMMQNQGQQQNNDQDKDKNQSPMATTTTQVQL